MKVEKNIPIPKRNSYPFSEMKVGDSFFFEDIDDVERCTSAAYSYAKTHKNGFTMTRRKVEGGYRIWRIS